MNNTVMSNNAWDTLSLPEKAGMMRVAVRNGIYNLKDIRDKYNKFAEGGDINDSWTLEDENNYQLWRASLPDNLKNTNDSEYDMRRAFKAGMNPSLEADGKYHLQSRDPRTGRILKAPYHPTYLQAINTDARMGYYPVVDTDGNTFTETWKGNQFKKGGRKKPVYGINNDATQQAMQYFIGKGLTDYQAAGLVGNLFRESRLNPTATNSGSGAYGIAQWLGDRKKNLFAKYGNNPSLSQQLDYVWHELNNTHKTGLNKLMSSRDSAEAARNAMGYYEFSAGPDAAIREMKKYGQNGERSMQEGINFASQLSGQPIIPYRTENPQWETIPFAPSNPEAFFNPASSYTPPTVEVEQPILKAAEDYAYNEQQERKDNLERFNMFMSMLNPSSNNSDLTDTVGLLSFGNRFDAGGPKKPVTKNDLRRMLQRNRAEAEAAYNSSIAETRTIPNDNAWVDRPLTRRKKNPHTERRAVDGAKADAAWRQEHPVATAIGAGLSAAPLAIAATPAVVGSGELGAAVLANPYVDAGLTSAFAGHGLNKLVNGDIENTADAVTTALELAPLGRLAKPLYEGVVQPGMRLFNSPLTGNWTKIGNREYRLSPYSLGANGSPLESRSITTELNISPEELYKALQEQEGYYFMGHGTGRTNVDPEVIFNNGLRIKNGDIANTTSPLSESNLVTWPHANSKEVIILPARAENTVFDSAYGRIPSDWYDANTFQWIDDPGFEGSGLFAVQKPNASFVETVVNGVPGVYTKPSAILGSYNTDTHVLRLNPNSQYKFPFSANTTPQITAENAANEMPNIVRTVQNNGKIRLSLPSHTDNKPRQFVLEPARDAGDNKYYVHMRMWDDIEKKIPASNVTNEEKQQLFDALYDELPEGAEILFPKSGPGNYGTRGTIVGLQRLARDPRFTPGTKGTLQYLDKDGKTVRTYEGTSFIKTPKITEANAASITPAQWTAAQDAAIARGDMAEAQRLRDLHFKTNAPNSAAVGKDGLPLDLFHGTRTAKGIKKNGFSAEMSGKGNRGANGGNTYLTNNYENAEYTGVRAREIEPIIDKVTSVYDLFNSKTVPSLKQIYLQVDNLSKQSSEINKQLYKLHTGTIWDKISTSLGLKSSPSNRVKKLQNIIQSNNKEIDELNRRAHIVGFLDDGLSFIGGNRDRALVNTLNFIKEPVNPTSPYRQIAADRVINAMYGTTDQIYSPEVLRLYGNFKSPLLSDFKMLPTDTNPLKAGKWSSILTDYNNKEKALLQELAKPQYDSSISKNKFDVLFGDVYIAKKPNSLKLADAVTYDNNGVRIPLGERDNFKLNNIRYGLLPFIGLGIAGTLYGKQE